MKRTRQTVKYHGFKVRILGWGNTYSAWVMAKEGRRLTRIAIHSGFSSKAKAIAAGKIQIDLLAA